MDKKLLIGGVILLALGGFAYMKTQEDKKVIVSSAKVDLPKIEGLEDVDTLSVTRQVRKDGKDVDEEVVLAKEGDKWVLKKPVAYAANAQAVKSALDNLKDVKLTDIIAQNLTDDMKKLYELGPEKALHIVAKKGAETKADWTIGKQGSRGQMVILGGKPSVYAVTGFNGFVFSKDVKAWRDTEILKFEDANVSAITLTNKSGGYSFTKGDKWGGTLKGKAIEKFDASKVDDLVRAFNHLDAADFGDGKPASDTGLDAPEATVTCALKDNAGKFTVKLGKAATGGTRYAMKDGNPTIFVIPSWPAEWATAEPTKFQVPPDAGAKDAGGAPPPGLQMPDMGGMGGLPPGMTMPEGHP